METEALRKLYRRIVKSFMDVIILSKLRDGPLSGYDIIAFVHDKYGFLMSSGTIYSRLYSLERDGLIEGRWSPKKRVYTLTRKGEENIKLILQSSSKLQRFILDIFGM